MDKASVDVHLTQYASENVREEAATRPEPDVDPKLLRAFLAVAREGHFGRAADSLMVAQSALSRQVQQLERLLGVSLFTRTPRGAEMTEAGRLVLPEAERAIAQNRRLVRVARSLTTQTGTAMLTVSAPLPSPPGGLLAEAVRHFRFRHQDVPVSVVGLDDHDVEAALRDGRVDVALTWNVAADEKGSGTRLLLDESASALLGPRHPWAGAAEMPLTALGEEPLLFPLRERGHCWAQLNAAASAARIRLTAIPTAPSAVPDLVAAGLGVSVVPASFRLAGYPGVTFVPVPGLHHRMAVRWRDDDSAAVRGFVASCWAAAGALSVAHPDLWQLPPAVAQLAAEPDRPHLRS